MPIIFRNRARARYGNVMQYAEITKNKQIVNLSAEQIVSFIYLLDLFNRKTLVR